MKIRFGFVSNSSSSCFLIVYKTINAFNDFEKFNNFSAYDIFINDLVKSDDMSGKKYIERELISEIHEMFYQFVENQIEKHDKRYKKIWYNINCLSENNMFDIMNFINHSGTFESYKDLMEQIRKIECDLINENPNIKNHSDDIVLKYLHKIQHINVESVVNDIYDMYTKNGYILRSISYADENSLGSYMEHQFVPFLAKCPEKDFVIFTTNNH